MTENETEANSLDSQLSILSVSRQWWHVCVIVILLCIQTLAWMGFTWAGAKDDAESSRELVEVIVYSSANAVPLFIVLSMTAALLGEFTGVLMVVLAQYLKRKFEKEAEAREKEAEARGEARGKGRNQAVWMAWYGRMKEAEARGETFDEPPPSENL